MPYSPWPSALAGRLDEHTIDSVALRDNPLGDPAQRPLLVYTPPGYEDGDRRYPTVYVLQGYTGALPMWRNRNPYRRPFPEQADTLIVSGEIEPVIIVYVDAWTVYGGSQYVDSPGTGRYHSYLCEEVVPYVDDRYRTMAEAAHRGVQGKSSGGFGAMITPMLRPDLFGALATHAGDTLYEHLYLPEFAKSVRYLRDFDGDIWRWWSDFGGRAATNLTFTRPGDATLLMLLGCTAAFSAAEDGTPELPFDPVTGVVRDDVWQRWLDWDPVRMVPTYADAMRGQRGVWIDAGTSDEWYLDLGAAAFRQALLDADVAPSRIRYELFDATHMAIDYRYPLSLAYLSRALGEG
jgi:S-formylglutathione hydrolase FrmB